MKIQRLYYWISRPDNFLHIVKRLPAGQRGHGPFSSIRELSDYYNIHSPKYN